MEPGFADLQILMAESGAGTERREAAVGLAQINKFGARRGSCAAVRFTVGGGTLYQRQPMVRCTLSALDGPSSTWLGLRWRDYAWCGSFINPALPILLAPGLERIGPYGGWRLACLLVQEARDQVGEQFLESVFEVDVCPGE